MDTITMVSGAVCAVFVVLHMMRRQARLNKEWE
jgi:hypothetical protein